MQAAVAQGEGAMAAILGLDFDAVSKVVAEAAEDQVCAAANDNDPAQVVVSGHLGRWNARWRSPRTGARSAP
jgi:[acyl-carrier-protein] S-malonyltransferase